MSVGKRTYVAGTISCFLNIHFPPPFSYSGTNTSHYRNCICQIPTTYYNLALKKRVCDYRFSGQWNLREFRQERLSSVIKKIRIKCSLLLYISHGVFFFFLHMLSGAAAAILQTRGETVSYADAEGDRAEGWMNPQV